MDKFLKLPLYQRLLIVGVALAVFAGGYFFAVITPTQDSIKAEEAKSKRVQVEYNSLSAYKDKETRENLSKEFEEEERKIDENKKMLPSEEEIPTFIISIKADADLAGLEILKFETKAAMEEDYYKRIPITMEVRGNFHQIVKFFKTLAAPKKRIVNITDLDIQRPPLILSDLKRLMGQSNLQRQEEQLIENKKNKADGKRDTAAEARRRNLRDWEEARKMDAFTATFVASAFSYTGNPISVAAKKRKNTKRKKRNRR